MLIFSLVVSLAFSLSLSLSLSKQTLTLTRKCAISMPVSLFQSHGRHTRTHHTQFLSNKIFFPILFKNLIFKLTRAQLNLSQPALVRLSNCCNFATWHVNKFKSCDIGLKIRLVPRRHEMPRLSQFMPFLHTSFAKSSFILKTLKQALIEVSTLIKFHTTTPLAPILPFMGWLKLPIYKRQCPRPPSVTLSIVCSMTFSHSSTSFHFHAVIN